LWTGGTKAKGGKAFDLRDIKAPIVLFASMGDNITPPQQAFNWVADVYGSTEEIKARGQVIVGLLHQDVGHLGIFVSGKVAKKEHAQIVSVLKSIETLTPGLYGMAIKERKGRAGAIEYEVEFREHTLEEIVARLNKFERADEKPFEAVAGGLRLQPACLRDVHAAAGPVHVQRIHREASPAVPSAAPHSDGHCRTSIRGSAGSDRRPEWSRRSARQWRRTTPSSSLEKAASSAISASLEYYRGVRDAASEAAFFQTYGTSSRSTSRTRLESEEKVAEGIAEAAGTPVRAGSARVDREGATPKRSRAWRASSPQRASPSALAPADEAGAYRRLRDLMPKMPADQWRAFRGEQEIIVRYEPAQALATLPRLLSNPDDRERWSRSCTSCFSTSACVGPSHPLNRNRHCGGTSAKHCA
jgi:hypothetical protein